jgi:RNA polymerase sigma factor (sigma-70 family)
MGAAGHGPAIPAVLDVSEPTPTGTTADGDDWNDEDPFASDSSAPPGPLVGGDTAVTRVAADLQDDYKRSGTLTLVDVTTLAQRRGLSSDGVEDVLLALAGAGVELSDERPEPGYDGAGDLDGGRVRRQVASVERDQLSAYLAAASRIRLLTAEQEVRLGRTIRAGQEALQALEADHLPSTLPGSRTRYASVMEAGRRAHRDLVSANLRLVVSIARLPRYSRSGVELPDRIQDGNTGLMRAADKYDPELGYKFSTYATWWIRQSIDRGAGDRGRAIRLPVHMYDQAKKVRAAKARLEGQLERPVALGELAADLSLEAGRVAAILTWSEPILSYDTLVGDEEDTPLLDLLGIDSENVSCVDPANVLLARQLETDVATVLATVLTPREVEVLQRRYGLDGRVASTLDDIGDQLGVTRERIRQIQVKAIKSLQADPRVDCLYEYLVDHALGDVLTSPLEPRETAPRKRRASEKQPRKAGRGLHV